MADTGLPVSQDQDPAMDPNLAARCPLATIDIMDPMEWYYKNYPHFANADKLHPEDDVDIIIAQQELVQIRLNRENARRDWELFQHECQQKNAKQADEVSENYVIHYPKNSSKASALPVRPVCNLKETADDEFKRAKEHRVKWTDSPEFDFNIPDLEDFDAMPGIQFDNDDEEMPALEAVRNSEEEEFERQMEEAIAQSLETNAKEARKRAPALTATTWW